jgi:cysteine desulfurase
VPVDRQGRLDLDYLYKNLSDDTAIVSVMWANNETGTIFPVEEIAREVRERGIVFHTDAVQAVGKIPINMADSAIDMLSISGHKLHAPKGIGVLISAREPSSPLFSWAGIRKAGRRAGTENSASIIAMGRAAQLAMETMDGRKHRVKGIAR